MFHEVLKKYRQKVREISKGENKCCILASVCRGKLSEGIDFSDNESRCVIIIGTPLGYYGDSRIEIKMKIMDKKCSLQESEMNGDEWYKQDAIRAVN